MKNTGPYLTEGTLEDIFLSLLFAMSADNPDYSAVRIASALGLKSQADVRRFETETRFLHGIKHYDSLVRELRHLRFEGNL